MKRLLPAILVVSACSQDIPPPPVRNLDRPTDIAFACFGDLRLNDGDPTNTDADIRRSAQPLESCVARFSGETPEGQEDLVPPLLHGFVLQSGPGTVALIRVDQVKSIQDSDPLTPGTNAIPIGTLPVGIVADEPGCHMVAANAGSCDLSVLDVTDALSGSPSVARVAVTNASGERVQAKPRSIVGSPPGGVIGAACSETASGFVYVAYPECNLVATVDASSGEIVAGVRFLSDGTQEITDGDVTCAAQCGSGQVMTALGGVDAGVADAGAADAGGADAGPPDPPADPFAGRPVAMHVTDDGSRLVIGAENSRSIVVAELTDGIPTSLQTIVLEGEVGVTDVEVTDPVDMGGELGTIGGTAGVFQFVYAIATDSTIRVANMDTLQECDTQIDPRYLADERDVSFLSCMPVGGPETPPRRAGAIGPGIRLSGVPTSIAFSQIELPEGQTAGNAAPTTLVGYYAFVSTANGFVFLINVDDDNYADFEVSDDPAAVHMPLAIAHQVRDFVRQRDEIAVDADGRPLCGFPAPDILFRGPRQSEPTGQAVSPADIAVENIHLLPFTRGIACNTDDAAGNPLVVPITELHFAAPVDVREQAFPDLFSTRNERWFFTWEGSLSLDGANVAIDGPAVRSGFITKAGGKTELRDASAPFCQMGAEPYDIAFISGCDPARGDVECGIGEVCFVHPDSPPNVSGGMCVPDDRKDVLSGVCRDFMITRRRYTVLETHADRLLLAERRRVLRTSPLDGCIDDAQCEEMFEVERRLTSPEHPIARGELPELDVEPTWSCEADPTRAPGPNRCVMTCESDDHCEDGFACSGGYCVEGRLPPAECVSTIQRYQVRAGDAFAVVGERSGFLHSRVVDTITGECVDKPDSNPLLVGRIPLRPPLCEGEGLLALEPNPCATTVDHTESFIPFAVQGEQCVAQPEAIRTRAAAAIRFSNPAMTFHLVDTETTGDLECRADLVGELPAHATVYPGYQFSMDIQGGFFPMFVNGLEPAFPIDVTEGPAGLIWVLDQGDDSSATKGQVFTLIPTEAENSFAFETLR